MHIQLVTLNMVHFTTVVTVVTKASG